jgi:Kef-type K+ transport system membrane component KefB
MSTEHEIPRNRLGIFYGLLIAVTALIFLAIRGLGETLVAPAPVGPSPFLAGAAKAAPDTLVHVLLALVVIILASRSLGALFRLAHQPAVVGEILAGLCLGPSLLGRFAPELQAFLLPASVAPFLGILAQIGVILFMFIVGLELDTGLLRKRSHATLAISHASIVAPFLLGATFALWLYPRMSSSDVPFTVFALFAGVSVSVTAFPVLARILTDRRMQKTRTGVIALTCAAVDDVSAWCLLALVVGVAKAEAGSALPTVVLSVGYILLMLGGIRPFVERHVRRMELRGESTQTAIAMVFVGLLLSTLATEAIGIHAIFGAFALGAILPHDSRLARELIGKLEDVVLVLFLPAFFAFTGMRTQIGLISGFENWMICGVIILIACAGKFGGSYAAARLTGLSTRDAATIGILMNTRGLMELVVLNIGLDLGVISPTLFAMMVIMALVTTVMTTPILHAIDRGDPGPQGSRALAGTR